MYLDNLSLYESKSRTFVLFESVVWNVSDFFSILFFQVSKQFVSITSLDPRPPKKYYFLIVKIWEKQAWFSLWSSFGTLQMNNCAFKFSV